MSTVFLKKIKNGKKKSFAVICCIKISIYMIKIKPGGVCCGPGGSPPIGIVGKGKRFLENIKPGRRAGADRRDCPKSLCHAGQQRCFVNAAQNKLTLIGKLRYTKFDIKK